MDSRLQPRRNDEPFLKIAHNSTWIGWLQVPTPALERTSETHGRHLSLHPPCFVALGEGRIAVSGGPWPIGTAGALCDKDSDMDDAVGLGT